VGQQGRHENLNKWGVSTLNPESLTFGCVKNKFTGLKDSMEFASLSTLPFKTS